MLLGRWEPAPQWSTGQQRVKQRRQPRKHKERSGPLRRPRMACGRKKNRSGGARLGNEDMVDKKKSREGEKDIYRMSRLFADL